MIQEMRQKFRREKKQKAVHRGNTLKFNVENNERESTISEKR